MNFKDTKLKVLSLVLILTMVFTTGVPVFAEDGGSSTPTETQSVEKATEKATEAPTQIATEKKATQAQTQANTQKSTVAKETKKGEATTGTSKTVKKVTVTYDANGGKEDNVYKTITLNDNDQASLTLPKNTFTRDGYEFAFWAKDKDATSGSDEGDSVTIKENTRYYAIWKKVETSEKDKTQVTTDKNSKDSVEESTEATESTEETDPTNATNNIDVANEEANNENISIIDVEGDETKGSYQIEVGATQSITGTRSAGSSWRDPNNHTTVYESWTSSNDNIASVSGSGKSATVKGVAEGEAIITHTYGEKMWSGFGPSRIYTRTETFKITVIAASTDPTLKVSPTTINMKKIGETHVVTPIIDNEPEGATITWSSSNEKVATVKGGASGGTVTAVANGTATITATLSYEDEGGIVQTLTASTTVNVDFTRRLTGVGALAECFGSELLIVDMGVKDSIPDELYTSVPMEDTQKNVNRKIRRGTDNLAKGPAMSREEALRAIGTGIEMANAAVAKGYNILGVGEMGIGNTTTSAAIISSISGKSATETVGRGGGLLDDGFARKKAIVNDRTADFRAKAKYDSFSLDDIIDIISTVGGFDICAMAGAFLGAAANRTPVVIDGVISVTAALVAYAIVPESVNYMIASHLSAEPGYKIALDILGLKPFLALGMRLGEGSGYVWHCRSRDMPTGNA